MDFQRGKYRVLSKPLGVSDYEIQLKWPGRTWYGKKITKWYTFYGSGTCWRCVVSHRSIRGKMERTLGDIYSHIKYLERS